MSKLVKRIGKEVKKGLKKGSESVKVEFEGKISTLDLIEVMESNENIIDIIINPTKSKLTIQLGERDDSLVSEIEEEGTGTDLSEAIVLIQDIEDQDFEEEDEDDEREIIPEPSKKEKKKNKKKKNKKR
jgi:hypothetical protein